MATFICSGALMRCNCGDSPSRIRVYPDRTVDLSQQPMANIQDHIPNKNIFSFGKCCSSAYPPTISAHHPTTCHPLTEVPWCIPKDDVLVRNNPAITTDSFCLCKWGGVIKFCNDGQTTNQTDVQHEPTLLLHGYVEKGDSTEEDINENWTWIDSVELVPVVGSIVGIGRSGMNGDWGMVAANVGFLALDIAGIVTLGGTTAAAVAGKTAVKAGVKVAAKGTVKSAAKQSVKAIEKQAVKSSTNAAAKPFLSVTARKGAAEAVTKETEKFIVEEEIKTASKEGEKEIIKKVSIKATQTKEGAKVTPRVNKAVSEWFERAGKVLRAEVEKFKNNNEISTFFRNFENGMKKIESEQQQIKKLNKIYNNL